jgi:ferrochelatase
VLVIAFGGPQGMADVRPFLANVTRGRRIPSERLEAVAKHYEDFGGVSPLTEITKRQVEGLRTRLQAAGLDIPVYLGMRNWHPLLPDTLRTMSADGVRRAIGFIAAAHRSFSSCTQYRQDVRDARVELVTAGGRDIDVVYVGDWHTHEGFIAANAEHVRQAAARLPPSVADRARVVFTAHSIPVSMPGAARYQQQLVESARLVAARLGTADWAVVFQSRSGRPEDPWLGPDICDYLRAERAAGLVAAVIAPIGFLCDHVEVLHDLDREAAAVARQIGLPMTRASTVNDAPGFLETMSDLVLQTWRRYEHSIPLSVAMPDSATPIAVAPARPRLL